jgi:hypothetical protein
MLPHEGSYGTENSLRVLPAFIHYLPYADSVSLQAHCISVGWDSSQQILRISLYEGDWYTTEIIRLATLCAKLPFTVHLHVHGCCWETLIPFALHLDVPLRQCPILVLCFDSRVLLSCPTDIRQAFDVIGRMVGFSFTLKLERDWYSSDDLDDSPEQPLDSGFAEIPVPSNVTFEHP